MKGGKKGEHQPFKSKHRQDHTFLFFYSERLERNGKKIFFLHFEKKTRGLGTTSLTSVGDGTELSTFNLSKILLSTTKIQRKGPPCYRRRV